MTTVNNMKVKEPETVTLTTNTALDLGWKSMTYIYVMKTGAVEKCSK